MSRKHFVRSGYIPGARLAPRAGERRELLKGPRSAEGAWDISRPQRRFTFTLGRMEGPPSSPGRTPITELIRRRSWWLTTGSELSGRGGGPDAPLADRRKADLVSFLVLCPACERIAFSRVNGVPLMEPGPTEARARGLEGSRSPKGLAMTGPLVRGARGALTTAPDVSTCWAPWYRAA